MKRILYPLIISVVVLLFFWKFFLKGLLPIPADTIVGMYHPWRDFFAQEYPNGIPFKNFLITDPVRQQYPWRKLAMETIKQGKWSLWNPYTFAGTPLLANFQSASFYPLNTLFFFLPFNTSWSFLVILQPILASLFLFLYLRHFNLRLEACFLGAISLAFSGFFVAWLEWNTVLHVGLWLPLILLSVEKVIGWFSKAKKSKIKNQISKIHIKNKKYLLFWFFILLFSLISSFFAGHLQTFFYVFLIFLIYAVGRIFPLRGREKKKALLLVALLLCCFVAIASIQWLPTLKFINLSAREVDQMAWQEEGWFIPWQNLIQFLVPDFFGNPSTLNYWGVWNYGELVGYIGIFPLIIAFLAMIWRKDKKTLFFGSIFFLSLILALPTPLAKLPYQLKVPFLSTSQPTRLMFLIDFSLAVLAALGFDLWLRRVSITRCTTSILIMFTLFFAGLWAFVLLGTRWFTTEQWITNLAVAKRNLILPTGLFLIIAGLLTAFYILRKSKMVQTILPKVVLAVTVFDLFRFGWKFTPFTQEEYLFPATRVMEFLQKQSGPFRIMAADKRILPPNFFIIYRLQTVEGYDPLYLKDYGELVAAWQREKPDISPFSFNRILTPQNYESRITDLLNVKYVLSLEELRSDKLLKVFEEGETKIYENKRVYPRSFLVESVIKVDNKQQAIKKMFDESVNLRKQAVVYDEINVGNPLLGVNENVEVVEYRENMLKLKVKADGKRLLVLTDNHYPSWNVFVDGQEEKIHKVNYTFRGVVVPEGEHQVVFSYHLP